MSNGLSRIFKLTVFKRNLLLSRQHWPILTPSYHSSVFFNVCTCFQNCFIIFVENRLACHTLLCSDFCYYLLFFFICACLCAQIKSRMAAYVSILQSFNGQTAFPQRGAIALLNETLNHLRLRARLLAYRCVRLYVPQRSREPSSLQRTYWANSIDTKTISVRQLEAKLLHFKNL